MKSYCGRLKHGRLIVGNRFVKRNCVLFRDHNIIRVASLLSGTDEAVVLAERIISLLAVAALHTGNQGSAGNTVAHFHFCDAFSHLHNISGKLMSQHYRVKMYAMVENTGNV